MSKPVAGPADVKPGDLVEVSGNGRTGVATVAKATAAGLSVRWPDGKTTSKAYTRTERASTWSLRGPLKWQEPNFHRLDSWERWHRSQPACDAVGDPYKEGCSSFTAAAIRDRPDDVIEQVRALSEWLKAEPPKDAP